MAECGLLKGLEGRPGLALVTALGSGLLVQRRLGRRQRPGRRPGAATSIGAARWPLAACPSHTLSLRHRQFAPENAAALPDQRVDGKTSMAVRHRFGTAMMQGKRP